MDKFIKIPCNINNKGVVDQDINKDSIIASITVSDMITPMNFTSDSKLYTDDVYLTLNMITQISSGNNNELYKNIQPENTPLIWSDDIIEKMKGTPLYSLLKSKKYRLEEIIKNSITNCKDMNQFIHFFYLIYSSVFIKSLILPIKGNNVICYIPVINTIKSTFNNDQNVYYEYKNENINIVAIKDIKKGETLKYTPKLYNAYELNFIKYGILPDNISQINISLNVTDYKINLQKNMHKDDKIMIRRIRKNPKHSELKKILQQIFNENIKLLKENLKNNNNDKDHLNIYSRHIYDLYKNNYPK